MTLTGTEPDAVRTEAEPTLACALTETQAAIGEAARRYLTDRYPPARVAELADRGQADLSAWAELERQGWLDAGLGLAELTVLAQESGRALHPAPWLLTAGLALPFYHAAGCGLPGPATLAGATGHWGGGHATATDDGWEIDGDLPATSGAQCAAEILVAADTEDGRAVFRVRPDGPGVTRTRREGIDPLREASDFRLTAAPARLLNRPWQAGPLLAAAQDRLAAMLAGEAVGVADGALAFAVDYAKVRRQFGRPIGSFQAVAHLLAEGYADVELARSLAYGAAFAVEGADPDAGQAVALAVCASTRAAVRVCEAAMQVCGGIGVTWEFPVHWWYRRALWLDAFHAAHGEPLNLLADAVLGGLRAPVEIGV
jgi:alkylation response protein AidB-like acyl-CoA dehydrogenase